MLKFLIIQFLPFFDCSAQELPSEVVNSTTSDLSSSNTFTLPVIVGVSVISVATLVYYTDSFTSFYDMLSGTNISGTFKTVGFFNFFESFKSGKFFDIFSWFKNFTNFGGTANGSEEIIPTTANSETVSNQEPLPEPEQVVNQVPLLEPVVNKEQVQKVNSVAPTSLPSDITVVNADQSSSSSSSTSSSSSSSDPAIGQKVSSVIAAQNIEDARLAEQAFNDQIVKIHVSQTLSSKEKLKIAQKEFDELIFGTTNSTQTTSSIETSPLSSETTQDNVLENHLASNSYLSSLNGLSVEFKEKVSAAKKATDELLALRAKIESDSANATVVPSKKEKKRVLDEISTLIEQKKRDEIQVNLLIQDVEQLKVNIIQIHEIDDAIIETKKVIASANSNLQIFEAFSNLNSKFGLFKKSNYSSDSIKVIKKILTNEVQSLKRQVDLLNSSSFSRTRLRVRVPTSSKLLFLSSSK